MVRIVITPDRTLWKTRFGDGYGPEEQVNGVSKSQYIAANGRMIRQ